MVSSSFEPLASSRTYLFAGTTLEDPPAIIAVTAPFCTTIETVAVLYELAEAACPVALSITVAFSDSKYELPEDNE